MIAISSSASTTAEDVRCQVVDLLAVLVSYDGTASGSGVGSKHDAILLRDEIFAKVP